MNTRLRVSAIECNALHVHIDGRKFEVQQHCQPATAWSMRACKPGGLATWVSALMVLITLRSATSTLVWREGRSWYSSVHCPKPHCRRLKPASTIKTPDRASPTACTAVSVQYTGQVSTVSGSHNMRHSQMPLQPFQVTTEGISLPSLQVTTGRPHCFYTHWKS